MYSYLDFCFGYMTTSLCSKGYKKRNKNSFIRRYTVSLYDGRTSKKNLISFHILKYTDGKIQQRDNKTSHRCHEDSETRVFYVSTAHSVRAPT